MSMGRRRLPLEENNVNDSHDDLAMEHRKQEGPQFERGSAQRYVKDGVQDARAMTSAPPVDVSAPQPCRVLALSWQLRN